LIQLFDEKKSSVKKKLLQPVSLNLKALFVAQADACASNQFFISITVASLFFILILKIVAVYIS
jgi:hypothetical protein